jgi:hypothetical protein
MKTQTLFPLILLAFLISCQTKTENVDNEIKKSFEITTSNLSVVSPMPSEEIVSKSSVMITDYDLKIGNVESGDQKNVCLKIQNPNLKIGDKVQIILPEKPPQILHSEIVKKAECKYEDNLELTINKATAELTGNNPEVTLSSYLLKLSGSDASKLGFGIGIVSQNSQVKNVKGLVSVDIDGDGKDEYFRECASNEGLHLTVWIGKPLVGKRIWHSYYHLNYDTENDCKNKDYEKTNG